MIAIDERPCEALLSDLLPYEAWDPRQSILWLKDGSATQTLAVTPKSSVGLVEDELLILRSGLTSTLNQIPEGVAVQFLLIRERSTPQSDLALTRWRRTHQGASEVTAVGPRDLLLNAKGETTSNLCEAGILFQTRLYLSVRVPSESRKGIGAKAGPFAQLAFLKKSSSSPRSEEDIGNELNNTTLALKTALESQGFETRNVNGTERLDLIYRFLNPERSQSVPANYDVTRPIPSLGEHLAMTDFLETRDGLRLGRFPYRIATLKALPDSSFPCLAATFATALQPFAFVLTVLMLPQTSERERLSRKQRLAQGMAAGNKVRNLAAETQLQEIEDTLSAMISSGEKLVAASFHVITWGESETQASAFSSLLSRAEELGPGCRWFEETVGAYPVFFGNLPFAPAFMPRPKRMLTSGLSDFLPLYGMAPGHEEAEVLFESPYFGSVLGFSLFEKSPSANAILIGSTGSGKSTLACGLILGMTAGNHDNAPSGFVIDVGNSFKRTVQYLGGSSLDLSPEKGTRINPFDLPKGTRA